MRPPVCLNAHFSLSFSGLVSLKCSETRAQFWISHCSKPARLHPKLWPPATPAAGARGAPRAGAPSSHCWQTGVWGAQRRHRQPQAARILEQLKASKFGYSESFTVKLNRTITDELASLKKMTLVGDRIPSFYSITAVLKSALSLSHW